MVRKPRHQPAPHHNRGDGEEAVAKAETEHPDLMVLDVVMHIKTATRCVAN